MRKLACRKLTRKSSDEETSSLSRDPNQLKARKKQRKRTKGQRQKQQRNKQDVIHQSRKRLLVKELVPGLRQKTSSTQATPKQQSRHPSSSQRPHLPGSP